MRSHESFDEFSIGFGEFIRVKIGRFHPSKVGNFDRARLAIRDRAVEEMKFDGLGGIVMRRREELIDDVCFDIELFAQLPSQRGFQRFSSFDFTAWKFPQVRKVNVGRTLRQKDVLVSMNDRCGNYDHDFLFRAVATHGPFPVWLPSLSAY